MERNQEIELDILRLGDEAQGVGLYEGQVVFVPKALPGERVRAVVIKPAKNYAVARLLEIRAPSPDRVSPRCPLADRCGGCAAQHMTYAATLAFKRQRVVDCLERIGGIQSPRVESVLGLDDPWRARNKAAFPVTGPAIAPEIGCYAPRSHTVIDAPRGCLLQTETSDRLVDAVRRWVVERGVPPYDEVRHTGLLRHIVTRTTRGGEAVLLLVTTTAAVPHADALIRLARQAVPSLRGIAVSPNPARTNVIFGETCGPLWGEITLTETLLGLRYTISPKSFFQVNAFQAERLYQAALDFLDVQPGERAADVYCGAGTLTLHMARAGGLAVGVEWSPDAVADAQRSAALNGIGNVRFACEDAARALPRLTEQGRLDKITLDPPRKGCDRAVLEAAARAGPARLVYISCDPATLARDARMLQALGYALVRAQPVDMFCWTAEVETAALFLPTNP